MLVFYYMLKTAIKVNNYSDNSPAYNPDPGSGLSPTRPGCLPGIPLVDTPEHTTQQTK